MFPGRDQPRLVGGRRVLVSDGLQERTRLHRLMIVGGQRLRDDRSAAGGTVEGDDRDPIALVRVRTARVALLDVLQGGDQRPAYGVRWLLPRRETEHAAGR